MLSIAYRDPATLLEWGGTCKEADSQGRFVFDRVGRGVEGYYVGVLHCEDEFGRCMKPLPLEGQSVTFRCGPGKILEGRVLDKKTGRPLKRRASSPAPAVNGSAIFAS